VTAEKSWKKAVVIRLGGRGVGGQVLAVGFQYLLQETFLFSPELEKPAKEVQKKRRGRPTLGRQTVPARGCVFLGKKYEQTKRKIDAQTTNRSRTREGV